MSTDFPGPGRDPDVGADRAGGSDADIGGSTSGGDAGDLQVTGSGQAGPSDEPLVTEDEARNADLPRGGTPDDLKPGKRRTVGLDEDEGAGMADKSGVPGSTTGGT
jgi:hypothetical protein